VSALCPDRAAAVSASILSIVRKALLNWLHGDSTDYLASVRTEIENVLRDEFQDIARNVVHEIRREDE